MDGGPGGKAGRAEAPASEPMPPVWASTDHAPHVLEEIPMLHTRAGPRDGNQWISRVKEEMQAVIALVRINKEKDNDWFQINPLNKLCTRWEGKCWTYYQDLIIPHLDGKTAKIYRGGRICLDLHFQPLWARNVPKFGIAHALALGLGPWLSLEIPSLVSAGLLPVTGTTAR